MNAMRLIGKKCVCVAVIAAWAVIAGATQPDREKIVRGSLRIGGLDRTWELFLPSSPGPYPLVIVLHGSGAKGAIMRSFMGFTDLAEQNGFLALFPDSIGPYWNDGRSDNNSPSYRAGVDDVEFLTRLLGHVVAEYHGDPARVYIAGFSNGGMMALRLGLAIPGKVAAVASVSGTLPKPLALRVARVPVPLLLIHGTEDRTVPWGGGKLVRGKMNRGEVLSVLDTLLFWAWNNGCAGSAGVSPMPDLDSRDGTRAFRMFFECDDPVRETTLIAIQGGGHHWPGIGRSLPEGKAGKVSLDVSATDLIWEFFSRHRPR